MTTKYIYIYTSNLAQYINIFQDPVVDIRGQIWPKPNNHAYPSMHV